MEGPEFPCPSDCAFSGGTQGPPQAWSDGTLWAPYDLGIMTDNQV